MWLNSKPKIFFVKLFLGWLISINGIKRKLSRFLIIRFFKNKKSKNITKLAFINKSYNIFKWVKFLILSFVCFWIVNCTGTNFLVDFYNFFISGVDFFLGHWTAANDDSDTFLISLHHLKIWIKNYNLQKNHFSIKYSRMNL